MSKVIITIEDIPGDRVKAVMNPPFAQIALKVKNSQTPLTPAEIYGVAAINKIMELSLGKSKEKTKIIIPRLRGY